ncbi:MAG TPA: hypothetical protein VHO47_01380 [Candidatus Babeliales bacterium]|nr:hypothetical protein [Candidatus Babeliales bacterium]
MKHYLIPLLLICAADNIQAMEQTKKPSFFSNIASLFSRQSSEQNLQGMVNCPDGLERTAEEPGSGSATPSESSHSLESITDRLSTPPSRSLRSSTELKKSEALLPAETEKEPKPEDFSSCRGNSGSPIIEPNTSSPVQLNSETTEIDSKENRLKELGSFVVAAQNAVNQQQIDEQLTQLVKKWTLFAHTLKKDHPRATPERKQINDYLAIMKKFGIKIDLSGLEEYESPDEFSYKGSFDPKRTLMKINNSRLIALEAEDAKYDKEEKLQLAHIQQINEQLRTAETKLGETKHSRLKKQTEKKATLEINSLFIDLQKQDHSYVTAKIDSLKKEITASYGLLAAKRKEVDEESDLIARAKMRNESNQYMQEISDKITSYEKTIKQLEMDKKSITDRLTPEQLKATGVWKKTLGLK